MALENKHWKKRKILNKIRGIIVVIVVVFFLFLVITVFVMRRLVVIHMV